MERVEIVSPPVDSTVMSMPISFIHGTKYSATDCSVTSSASTSRRRLSGVPFF